MSDLTDDLLDDLDQLETTTTELEEMQVSTKKKQGEASQVSSANTIDAASLSLEAAKASQEAAIESQKAANTAINLSQELKATIFELSDSNNAWRQATHHTNLELKSARSSLNVTLFVVVFLSFISTSLAGWLLYKTFQENNENQVEIIDIIQTENVIFNQGIEHRINQISSLIEMLTMDIKRLEQPPLLGNFILDDSKVNNLINHQTQTTIENAIPTEFKGVSIEQYKELKYLVEQILDKQQKLQASLLTHTHKPPKEVEVKHTIAAQGGLTAKQSKQLDGISWLIRQQEKTLKTIQDSLKASAETQQNDGLEDIIRSLNQLKSQVNNLSIQQNTIESQVKVLQKETEKLTAKPPRYSFRLREE